MVAVWYGILTMPKYEDKVGREVGDEKTMVEYGMQITVNGETKDFTEEQVNVSLVLARQHVESPDMVAVQVNGAFVDKGEFDALLLKDGDSVEFLYFMGGGAV